MPEPTVYLTVGELIQRLRESSDFSEMAGVQAIDGRIVIFDPFEGGETLAEIETPVQ